MQTVGTGPACQRLEVDRRVDGVPALPPGALSQRAESTGLASGQAVADVHAAGREHQEQRFVAEKLTVHQLLGRTAERYVSEYRDGEATMSRFKHQMGMARLRVRGTASITYVATLRALGLNIRRLATYRLAVG